MIDYGLVFVAGVLASLHCVGMCGPIVLAYSLPGKTGPTKTVLHLAYNGGRVLSYTLLGALGGALGMGLYGVEGIGSYVAIVAGVLVVVAGLFMMGVLPVPAVLVNGVGGRALRRLHGALLKKKSTGSKLLLGGLTPLLPCGMLYAMLFKAAAEGSAVGGATTMAVFGAGMVPALGLMGSLTSFISGKVRRRADILMASTFILLGGILLMRGFQVPYLQTIIGSGHCH